ncbi:MAG TPA: VWA domain-containing protein [Acidobacteriaceae bacterium]|jgi:Ca-activated chloride channel family protein|nr:VWA domain-containing protein [Acidobacteriaceae bacterium]
MQFRYSLLLALYLPIAGIAQDAPVFHAETHLVTLTFSARDGAGHFIDKLGRDDFSVYEDGVEQKLSAFSRESELPLTLGLLIDASQSQKKFLEQHQRDIQVFLGSILRPQDKAFAVCFGDRLRLVSDLTSDPAVIIAGIEKYKKSVDFPELARDESRSGGTAVYDAIFGSVNEKMAGISAHRKALIMFTDGEENSSAHDEIDAIAEAQSADVLVYAVRYTEMKHNKLSAENRQGITGLHHIAEQTGGRDFDALHTDLPETFKAIGDELRSVYSIGYYSTNKTHDDTFRKIVIEPHVDGVTVRAKSGYYAK